MGGKKTENFRSSSSLWWTRKSSNTSFHTLFTAEQWDSALAILSCKPWIETDACRSLQRWRHLCVTSWQQINFIPSWRYDLVDWLFSPTLKQCFLTFANAKHKRKSRDYEIISNVSLCQQMLNAAAYAKKKKKKINHNSELFFFAEICRWVYHKVCIISVISCASSPSLLSSWGEVKIFFKLYIIQKQWLHQVLAKYLLMFCCCFLHWWWTQHLMSLPTLPSAGVAFIVWLKWWETAPNSAPKTLSKSAIFFKMRETDF